MHWYTKEGKTAYNAGLKQAREEKLLPSVTEITGMESLGYGLIEYIKREVIKSALTIPRFDNETDDELINRILAEGKQHSRRAMKIGNIIHHMIASYIREKPFYVGIDKHIHNIFNSIKDWIDENVILGACEQVLASSDFVYAGTCDFRGLVEIDGVEYMARVDWKTQDVRHPGYSKIDVSKKLKDKVNFYDSWCMQLVAYEEIDTCKTDVRISVVIGTNPENYGVWFKVYTPEEEEKALRRFNACKQLFYIKHNLER